MRNLVLWGHSLQDYREMFDLTDENLQGAIVDCGSGPTSFNAEMEQAGHQVVSVDELFGLESEMIARQAHHEFDEMQQYVSQNQALFNWDKVGSLHQLVEGRQEGINTFLHDITQGKADERYVGGALTHLPYEDFSFDLALCSHYLFANIPGQDLDYHVAVIKELCRVAKEVRFFPLADRENKISDFLGPVLLALQNENYGTEVRHVPYRLQKEGNALLRVWAHECSVETKGDD